MRRRGSLLAVVGAAVIAGCAAGARDGDYSQQRGIADDIDASHLTNPRLLQRGQIEHDEPYDAFPWRLDERHQSGE